MKSKYNRRYFLKGAGTVLIGMPLLEESFFRQARAAEGDVPKRLLTMSFGLGIERDLQAERWNGPLAPMQNVAAKTAFFSNLTNDHLASAGNPHIKVAGSQFTGVKQPTDRQAGGPSLEQIMRQALHPNGVPSLTGLPSKSAGIWSRTASPTQYIRHWNNDGSPGERPERRPSAVFDALFGSLVGGGGGGGGGSDAAIKQAASRRSILDGVLDQYRSLTGANSPLGQASKMKIEGHLDAIRSIELELARADDTVDQLEQGDLPNQSDYQDPDLSFYDNDSGSAGGGAPLVSYTAAQQAFRLTGDLFALAMETDALRFGSMIFVGAGGHIRFSGTYEATNISRNFDFSSISNSTPHDEIIHFYVKDAVRVYQHYCISQLAYVLDKMDSIMEPNGKTLLDNSCVVMGTEYGKNHSSDGIFHAVVGGNGLFKPGFYDSEYGFNDVYKTVLEAYGVQQGANASAGQHQISGTTIGSLLA